MLQRVYVAELVENADLAAKIRTKHDLTWAEVREAVLWPATFAVRWVDESPDDPRARRLLCRATTATGRRLKVILYPVDEGEGVWRLGTAFDDT